MSGTLALLALAMPGTAAAADTCGLPPLVAGTVACAPLANPYATGIAYVAPPADLTIVLQDGVRIDTTATPNTGLLVTGDRAFTVNGGTNTIITTTGDGAHGAQLATLANPLSLTLDRISTSGINADGINVLSTGGTATVNAGTISTTGINSDGIIATGAAGVTLVDGATISTTGQTARGVVASSSAGPVAVTLRNVSTTGNGSQAVILNADAGNATATVNGVLRTTGANADALTVNSGANAVVNLGAGAAISTVQGDYIRLNATGASTLNNAAAIGNNAAGYALVANGRSITINNTGNFSSDIVLTGGADVINNSGTFTVGPNPDFGAGVDSFNNAGLVTLMAGGVVPVSPVFTSLESFTNGGAIDLINGRVGDTLTLPGTYAGAGGTLGLDVTSNGVVTTADRLIVGGAATGVTTILLNPLADSQTVFNPGTVLINAGAGTSANAFGLTGGGIDAGFVRYQLGFDAANNDFVLTGAPSDAAFRTLNYAEGVRSLWLKSADAVSTQLRARRDALWSKGGGDTASRFWLQIQGSKETREGQRNFNAYGQSRLTNTGYDQDYFGGQIGLDISGGSGERGGFAFGVTGGYLSSLINFAGVTDRVKFDVANAGVYASYSAGNIFFNALGKYDHYWARANVPGANFQQNFSGNIYGARAEMGLRFGSDRFYIEPAASISYVKNDSDNLTPVGVNIAFNEEEGLRGRFGARIGSQMDLGGPQMALYAGMNYVHEFKGRDNVTFTSGGQTLTYTNTRLRDYGEATLGMTIAQNAAVSGFIEANYIRSFKENNGQLGMTGLGGRAGIRFKL